MLLPPEFHDLVYVEKACRDVSRIIKGLFELEDFSAHKYADQFPYPEGIPDSIRSAIWRAKLSEFDAIETAAFEAESENLKEKVGKLLRALKKVESLLELTADDAEKSLT